MGKLLKRSVRSDYNEIILEKAFQLRILGVHRLKGARKQPFNLGFNLKRLKRSHTNEITFALSISFFICLVYELKPRHQNKHDSNKQK